MVGSISHYTDHPLEHCVARVWSETGNEISGTAFLLVDELLCTCTHVLQGKRRKPAKNARINFPFLSDATLNATVVKSLPVEKIGGDIAFLALSDPLPPGAIAMRMFTSRLAAGTPCDTYGFPLGFEMGLPASATMGSKDGMGWRSLTTTTSNGVVVEAGFSGAPVWDLVRQCVVGMIVAVHRQSFVSFLIPSELIADACPKQLALDDVDFPFDERSSEIFVQAARRIHNPDLIADYLGSLLTRQQHGVHRKWIYLTLGRIGGARAAQVLRVRAGYETDLAALDGLEDARKMLGVD